jgi:hypothetical protein
VLVRRPVKPAALQRQRRREAQPLERVRPNIGCALSHRRFIRNGDAWVGITAKPIAVAALKAFDPARYGSLAFANPCS